MLINLHNFCFSSDCLLVAVFAVQADRPETVILAERPRLAL